MPRSHTPASPATRQPRPPRTQPTPVPKARVRGPASEPPVAAPRFATAWAALAYAVTTLALGFPALAGRFLVNQNSDQYIAGYAFREYAAASLRAGHGFPQWNPYLFGGVPFVAAMSGDVFYPTFLLRMALPTDVAMTWGFVVHVFLAGLFTFVFLRAMGLGFFGALVGGLAYLLGGNVAGLVSPGHDGKLFVSALLPLVLFLAVRGVRDGRAWAWGALALSVTLAALSPHPQLFQYLLLTAGAFALFLAFARREDTSAPLPRPVALRRLALAAGAVALGTLGAAVQYWPVLEYAPWSPRAGGRGWEHAVSYSLPPEELLNTYLPQFSGVLELYSGRNGIHLHSEYLGAAVLVLAGLAYGGGPSSRRLPLRWFWTGALAVATLWALGGYTPFYHLVYAVVPGTKFFRAPSTMLYVVSFCTAVLAGLGVDRALAAPPRLRYALAWAGAATLVAVLATSGVLTGVAASFAHPQLVERAYANAGALTAGAWRSWLAVVVAGGVLVALARGALSPRAAGWTLVAIVALDLWSVERRYWQFSPPASQLYASDAAIDYLRRLPQPGRVLPLAAAPMTGTIRDPYLGGGGEGKATGFMVHGVRNVVGYHGNELGRYDALSGWESDDYLARMSSANVRRLLNVRFLYTNTPTTPIPGARLVAGPARNAAGNTVYLYELAEDNPAAWVAPLAVKAPDNNVLATLLDPRFDLRRAALFDTAAAAIPAQPVPPALPAPSDVTVRVTRWEPGHIALALDRPAPAGGATLVVSENYYPGWTAAVDGKPAAVARADYVLTGVALPAGARSAELTFRSARYQTGKALTLAALLLAALWAAAGVVSDRR